MRPENFNLDLLGNRALLLKGLKNNKAPDSDSVVNVFFKYGGYEVKKKLLKIMNYVFKNRNCFAI